MYSFQVSAQDMLVLKHQRANVTLESLDVTNTVDSGYMALQATFLRELSAANLELVTSFGAACMSDVVSADLQYVAERHVTKLALYVTRLPNLLT